MEIGEIKAPCAIKAPPKAQECFFSFAIKQKEPHVFLYIFDSYKRKIHRSVKLTFLLRQEMQMEECVLLILKQFIYFCSMLQYIFLIVRKSDIYIRKMILQLIV